MLPAISRRGALAGGLGSAIGTALPARLPQVSGMATAVRRLDAHGAAEPRLPRAAWRAPRPGRRTRANQSRPGPSSHTPRTARRAVHVWAPAEQAGRFPFAAPLIGAASAAPEPPMPGHADLLLAEMDAAGVAGALIVQARGLAAGGFTGGARVEHYCASAAARASRANDFPGRQYLDPNPHPPQPGNTCTTIPM